MYALPSIPPHLLHAACTLPLVMVGFLHASRNVCISVSSLLNKHLTCNGLLILNLAGAHDGTPSIALSFRLPATRSEMTSALLLNDVAYITGAADPSDHLPAGIMNTSIGSGSPWNCGFSMTGELDRSAPQTAPSMSGV
jgi:hypothetical protein